MKVIDSFLVALGFTVDDESVEESQKAIDEIQTSALQMGGILSAAFTGAGIVARRTAQDIDAVYDASKTLAHVGISELDAWRHAFLQAGGDAEEAHATFSRLESLLGNFQRLGEIGAFEDLAKLNLPHDFLTSAKTSVDLFKRLSTVISQLDEETQGLAIEKLGLGRGANILLREGPGQISDYLADAEKFGVMTDAMGEGAEKLVQASNNLDRAWQNLVNLFTSEAAEGIAQAYSDWADLLTKLQDVAKGSGGAYGNSYSFLAPAAAVGTGSAGAYAAGKVATKAGMAGVGSALTGAAKVGAKAVPILGAASMWNIDKDIEGATGYDLKDNPYVGWLFRPMGELFEGEQGDPMLSRNQRLKDRQRSSQAATEQSNLSDRPFDPLAYMDYQRANDVTQMTHTDQRTYEDNRQYNFGPISVDGAGDADRAVSQLESRLKSSFAAITEKSRTAEAG